MTAEEIDVVEVDRIERGDATRPWRLNEMTVQEIGRIESLHRDIDTAFVPWRAQEPVDKAEVLFTADERVMQRRDRDISDVAADVIEHVENDPQTGEYVVWDQIEPTVYAAPIDDARTRIRIHWTVGGE